jgi:hypothetical protein
MTLKEFTQKNFAGNITAFCAWADINRATYYRIAASKHMPQMRLRKLLTRKGVHFPPITKINKKATGLRP